MKKAILFSLRVYQYTFSPDTGLFKGVYGIQGSCRMYPTCSAYMSLSVEKHGAMKGLFFGILRIGRCHPFQKKLIDIP